MSNDIQLSISRARSSAVGADHGVTPGDLKKITPSLEAAHKAIKEERSAGRHGFYDVYKDKTTLRAVKEMARRFKSDGIENLVILGIGGSALGTSALVTALRGPYYNLLTREQRRGCPRIFVMDNIDADSFQAMLDYCDPSTTLFNVISKSGGTAETLAQLLIVLGHLEKRLGKSAVSNHVLFTSDPPKRGAKRSPLHAITRDYQLEGLEMPANVGGRFSVFTSVGLFPAAMLGMDIAALLGGCRAMDKRCSQFDLGSNPAYQRAAFQYIAYTKKNKSLSVMMPYSDALRDIADWYRQLWAESLGKRIPASAEQEAHFVGQTPIKALGVTDQHSQLQLYLEGPNDKIHSILQVKKSRVSLPIPQNAQTPESLAYLKNRSMNELLRAECIATMDALEEAERPVMTVTLPSVEEHTLGQLLYLFQYETSVMGKLLGLNPYDQPAVERIKVLTRKTMRK